MPDDEIKTGDLVTIPGLAKPLIVWGTPTSPTGQRRVTIQRPDELRPRSVPMAICTKVGRVQTTTTEN